MSDRRRQIAERLIKEATPYAHLGNAQYINAQDVCERAMSEYAAALLEEMAAKIDDPQTCEQNVVKVLRERAAQERAR